MLDFTRRLNSALIFILFKHLFNYPHFCFCIASIHCILYNILCTTPPRLEFVIVFGLVWYTKVCLKFGFINGKKLSADWFESKHVYSPVRHQNTIIKNKITLNEKKSRNSQSINQPTMLPRSRYKQINNDLRLLLPWRNDDWILWFVRPFIVPLVTSDYSCQRKVTLLFR